MDSSGRSEPRGRTWRDLAASFALPAKCRVGAVSRGVRPARRIGLLDFFLGLVTGTGTAGRADRTTDDRAGRSGDRATDEGTGSSATKGARARTGLVVAFGRLTGDRTTDGADRATDHCARRSTDGHADGRAAECTGPGAHCLGPAFLVLGGGAGPARPSFKRSSSWG